MGTSWHLLCGNRCQLVSSSVTCLVGYELTSNGGTSWHHLVVRVDIYWWYELTSIGGTSWHGYELTWVRYELTWVRVDMGTSWHLLCGNRCQLVPPSDTCLVGYELTSNGGTSWHHLVVRVDIYWWYELTWVRVDMGTKWQGYELTWIRVDWYSYGPKSSGIGLRNTDRSSLQCHWPTTVTPFLYSKGTSPIKLRVTVHNFK